MANKLSVAFIGTGIMGAPIAGHILDAGYPVTVNNRTKSKAAALVERGAVWADTPADAAANADVIFTMVGYPSEVEELYLAGDGLLACTKPGAVLIDLTTSSPELARDIAEAAQVSGRMAFAADNAYFFHLTKLLKAAHINFACAPTENLYLQGRQDTFPKRRGITRVKELTEAGVNVSLGQDSMQDPWYPLGNGNMMLILDYVLHLAQMMSFEEIDDALKFLTINGATTLGMRDSYGLEAGKPANFIVLDASSVFDAVYERCSVLRSVREGRTLFTRTETVDTDLELLTR